MRAWIETSGGYYVGLNILSHAVCVRGLKPLEAETENFAKKVARRVRAWIETASIGLNIIVSRVARRVRAWIETLNYLKIIIKTTASHAVCVRGLKLELLSKALL